MNKHDYALLKNKQKRNKRFQREAQHWQKKARTQTKG